MAGLLPEGASDVASVHFSSEASADSGLKEDVEAGLAGGSEARAVVTCKSPFKIHGANTAFAELMAVSPELIARGPNLRLLFGPSTDGGLFESCLQQTASTLKEQELQVTVYDTNADPHLIRFSLHPCGPTDGSIVLTLTSGTPLLSLEESKTETTSLARAFVSLRAPFHVDSINQHWKDKYELGSADSTVVGRTLKVFEGPGTDLAAVQRLQEHAQRGLTSTASVLTYTTKGAAMMTELTFTPLVGPSGGVTHAAVQARTTRALSKKEAERRAADASTLLVECKKGTITSIAPHTAELVGHTASLAGQRRTLSVLCGPATDQDALKRCIDGASDGSLDGERRLVTLYRRDASPLPCFVSGSPILSSQMEVTHVEVLLTKCDAPALATVQADGEQGASVAVLSARWPHEVQHASEAWAAALDFSAQQATGQKLQVLQGPGTESKSLARLLEAAAAGERPKGSVTLYCRGGEPVRAQLELFPVMAPDGAVRFVGVTLAASPLDDSAPPAEHAREAARPRAVDLSQGEEGPPRSRAGEGGARPEQPGKEDAAEAERRGSGGAGAQAQAGAKFGPGEDMFKGGTDLHSKGGDDYPVTPAGHIKHINGYTRLVLYPKADPTLANCIAYLGHLKDAGILKSWAWQGDALHANVDTRRVLNYTDKSPWCRVWTADLRSWHAWWCRMLWYVSEASRKQESDRTRRPEAEPCAATHGSACDLDYLSEGHSPLALRCGAAPAAPDAAQLRALLGEAWAEACDEGACVLDGAGQVLWCNRRLAALCGCDAEQLAGAHWTGLLGPAPDQAAMARLEVALAGAITTAGARREEALLALTGAEAGPAPTALLVAAPVLIGRASGGQRLAVLCAEDCSELAALEEELGEELGEHNDPWGYIAKSELAAALWCTADALAAELALAAEELLTPRAGAGAPRGAANCAVVTLPLPLARERLRCIEALWNLRESGWMRGWCWETDALSVEVEVAGLRAHWARHVCGCAKCGDAASARTKSDSLFELFKEILDCDFAAPTRTEHLAIRSAPGTIWPRTLLTPSPLGATPSSKGSKGSGPAPARLAESEVVQAVQAAAVQTLKASLDRQASPPPPPPPPPLGRPRPPPPLYSHRPPGPGPAPRAEREGVQAGQGAAVQTPKASLGRQAPPPPPLLSY